MRNELTHVDALTGLVSTARSDGRIELLRSVLDDLPALFALTDASGRVEFVNRRAVEYFERSFEEMKDWVHAGVLHPDDLPAVVESWARSVEGGKPFDMECRFRRGDGIYRWFHVRTSPTRDIEGRIACWHAVASDIDDRRLVETELAGEKQLLEMIATGRRLPDVLSSLCTFFERAAVGCLCGVYPIDWSGPTFQNAVAPTLPATYLAPVEGLPVRLDAAPCGLAALQTTQVVVEDIDSDPRWRGSPYRDHVLSHGLRAVWSTPIASLEGHVLGTFCIYRRTPATPSPHVQELIAQVTHIASIAIDRARSEAALRSSEAYLAEAQKLSLTGSFGWHVADDRHVWSDETFRIFGYDRSVTVTLRLILQRVHPQDLDLVRQMIARAEDGTDIDHEYRLAMPDGSVKHVHVVAHGIRDGNGRLEYIGAIQDVTQQRHSEEALGKLRSELSHVARITGLSALTASIAHEVNQPLSGIMTNASTCLRMLASDPPNVAGARETARRTIRDGNRASDVITRLRALFARQTQALEPVDLNEATREVLALSRTELQRSGASMRAELGEDLPTIMGDRIQLQQVIMNLLRNASDAMIGIDDRPREILISTFWDDDADRVCLSVRDSGAGFESQSVDKVFDAFYTTKQDGMGIGLSVSRSIIESHRGRLWVTPNDGPGVTFSFAIPLGLDFGVDSHNPDDISTPAATGDVHARTA